MRTSHKLISALAIGGIVVAGGSAFTATSAIDNNQKYVGAVGQSISGVHVSSVQYVVDGSDRTSAVSFHVTEALGGGDTVTATISDGSGSDAQACTKTPAVFPATGTDLACTFTTGVVNVSSLQIVAS